METSIERYFSTIRCLKTNFKSSTEGIIDWFDLATLFSNSSQVQPEKKSEKLR